MNAKRFLLAGLATTFSASALALTLAQKPLFISGTEPRAMLVLSRDHQLSMKAYTDYTDVDASGSLDITYNDGISYYGYFDPNKCYQYSSSRFAPSGAVTSGTHQCGGDAWSGNFLNWATMTRMDVLRKTLYGGYRSTDTTSETVLERQFLPVDVHAFVKVYTPTASMPTIQSLTGITISGSNPSISLCNVSDSTSTTSTGQMSTLPDPLIKVASGRWPQWDASEVTQCALGSGTRPSSLLSNGTYVARVKVCDSTGGTESNCKTYTHPTTGAQTSKPVGLLQQYGDVDAVRRVRFGLMTGSYAANKSGGVLRKNAKILANNNGTDVTSSSVCGNNNGEDEINVCTGQFINQGSTQAGIVNTINRIHIAGFQYTSSGGNGSHQYSCNSPGIASFNNGQCVDWGNPLSEMYLESLRYFANAGATTTFNVSDSSILSSIPSVTWTDPLPDAEWCALSNIIVISTGLNSFDTDQLTAFTPTGGSSIDAATLTNTVGDSSHENINTRNWLIGDNGSTSDNQCTAKTISNLSTAKGICPEVPSLQGGYSIAGLAYAPKTIDIRPGYLDRRTARWGTTGINRDWALRQPLNTYTVQLAETLPSFSAAAGSGAVTLLPACQANSTGSASAWTSSAAGWRNCSMTNLIVEDNVASTDVGSDTTAKTKTCSGNGTTAKCFTVSWEDSTWGNDYDMDGIQRLGFCVGSACDTFKMLCPTTSSAYATIGVGTGSGATWTSGSTTDSQVRVVTCAIQAQAGHALTFGYTLTGTTSNGAFFPILRPGGSNFNVGGTLPSAVTAPNDQTFTQGTAAAQLLKNPLWYAAKYGGFVESDPTSGTPSPNVLSEWDAENNVTGAVATSGDGDPDNYFNVRNPANLITALSRVFDKASMPDASASSVATNSTDLQINSRVYQGRFSSADWSGQLLSYNLSTTGTLGSTPEWDSGLKLNQQIIDQTPSGRIILTKGSTDGVAFAYASLTGPSTTAGTEKNLLDKDAAGITDNCGLERVAWLRGDATNEAPSDTSSATFTCASGQTIRKFRRRATSKLGDIVDSSPWYVGAPSAGYSDVDNPGYSTFRSAKLSRTPVVYVGANDGMVHGFDASLDYSTVAQGSPTTSSGREKIAYIPTAVYPNLSKLMAQNYNRNHRYFVDGSPMAADADLGSSTRDWRTVLIGGLSGGGKGYYALDVSDPSAFGETGTAPADTVLWEFDETDMGYAYNLPPAALDNNQAKQIVKLANGKWAAVLGNGYKFDNVSGTGKAVLYVVFINGGMDGTWTLSSDYVKIVADVPTGADNGLSTPVPFDSNDDGYADTVYAGDLKGRIWKFLIGPNSSDSSVTATPSTWKLALSGSSCASSTPSTCTPLFTATDSGGLAQPIVSPPEISLHPQGGQLVLFGTGKYIESNDVTNTSVQTFYGIWDRNDGTTIGTRAADLRQQTISSTQSTTVGNFRVPSTNTVNWRPASGGAAANCSPSPACNPTHMGWYMDLPTSKERTVGIPKLVNGVIFFNTLIPSDAVCEVGGTGWLMALDYLNGSKVSYSVFDTNGNGAVGDTGDLLTGGYQIGATLGGSTLITPPASANPPIGVAVSSLTSGNLVSTLINFGAGLNGRLSWREIVQ